MKKLVALVFLLNVFGVYAQDKIEVIEEKVKMGKTTLTAFVLTVGHNPETVKKSFTRYCREKYKIKLKSEGKGRLVGTKVNIPTISDKTGDLRVMVFGDKKIPKLAVGFMVGYDMAVNSNDYPSETAGLKKMVREYAVYHESRYFREILNDNQKRLNELVNNLENNEKELKSLTRRIRKIDKTVRKEQDPDKQFDLSNKNIANRAKVQAIHDIIKNLKAEILKIDTIVGKTRESLQKLENQAY